MPSIELINYLLNHFILISFGFFLLALLWLFYELNKIAEINYTGLTKNDLYMCDKGEEELTRVYDATGKEVKQSDYIDCD
jgi:hypothetical protein